MKIYPKSMSQTWLFLSYLVIGLGAFLPRLFDLGTFGHTDELNFWLKRSYIFLEAIQKGNFAGTVIAAHPGVTTMWLGSWGILLRRFVVGQTDSFPLILTFLRLPVVLTHSCGIVLGYWLLRQLFAPRIAFLAAILWATDPFVTASNRILHVDGLMGTFLILSLLAACIYWNHKPSTLTLILSGSCGSLALLSKSPALAILPTVLVIALTATSLKEGKEGKIKKLLSLGGWGSAFGLTTLLVWPAVWAAPQAVYAQLRVGVEVEGSAPHVIGNYFLGRPDAVPGPLFYPVALAFRLTPWALLGLFLLPFSRSLKEMKGKDLAILAGFSILFIASMTPFPKKLNRYLSPIFPLIDILAAVGLAWGANFFRKGQTFTILLITLVAGANAAWYHPYGVVYFNPLLGGDLVGANTFLTGEGEGMGETAVWLNQQPDLTGVKVVSTMTQSLQPFLRRGAQIASPTKDRKLPPQTGYVVIYVRHIIRGLDAPFNQFYPQQTPLHVVKLHGLPYVFIYQVPPPIAQPMQATFGQAIALHGYEGDTSGIREKGSFTVKLQWQRPLTATVALPADAFLFLHLLDAQGTMVAQAEIPVKQLTSTNLWQRRSENASYPLAVPTNLSPGPYWLTLGFFHAPDATRLPLLAAYSLSSAGPKDGENALLLGPFTFEEERDAHLP